MRRRTGGRLASSLPSPPPTQHQTKQKRGRWRTPTNQKTTPFLSSPRAAGEAEAEAEAVPLLLSLFRDRRLPHFHSRPPEVRPLTHPFLRLPRDRWSGLGFWSASPPWVGSRTGNPGSVRSPRHLGFNPTHSAAPGL
jgi:hypothetical protein